MNRIRASDNNRLSRNGARAAAVGAALLASASLSAGQVREPPPPPGARGGVPTSSPTTGQQASCFPPCREGYLCHVGQCVPICNPPCPSDQVCIDGRRCDYAFARPAGHPIEEPPPPLTKAFADRGFLMVGFHYGFSGNYEHGPLEIPLDSTFGFNLRGDVPIDRYLLLGPLLQFGAWRPDVTPTPSRNFYVDLALFLRGRIPVTTESANFQIWAGIPIGFTFDVLGDTGPGASDVGFGWNVGVLFGGAVHFTPNIGVFSELGWLQHKMNHGKDIDLRLGQWNFNVGLVFRN